MIASLLMALLVQAPVEGPAPSNRPVLTLEEAVRTALEQQPQARQAKAQTEAAYARADEARSSLLPQVTANASFSQSTANFAARPGSLPGGATGATSTASWNTNSYITSGIQASELIFDFGSTWNRWRASRALADAQRGTELGTKLLILLNARVAYFGARAQKALVQVGRETLTNQQKHLRQIRGFVEVGTRPEIDLAQARTDEANARVLLITAENNYETQKAQLNQAMGVERSTDYDVGDEALSPVDGEDQSIEPLLGESIKARPEFAALEEQVRAQQLTLDSTWGAYWPVLAANTGFSDNGQPPINRPLVWNWSAQLTLQWNLFQGLLTTAQEREARANLASLEAQRDLLKQQLRLEVEQARLAVRGAKAAVQAAAEAVENARERLKLAEGRYQTGVGSIIELGDAQVALTTAASQDVQAQFNLATARAQLIKALGRVR